MKLKLQIKKDSLRFIQRAKNFENIFNGILIRTSKQVGAEIKKTMQNIMKSGGWEENDPEYLYWKANHGYGTDPLFRTSLLHNSISVETKINLPNSIGGEVGWQSGARYPGNLRGRQWKRGVSSGRRRRNLGTPDTEAHRESNRDTNFLAQVAQWNETGAGQRVSVSNVTKQIKNGMRGGRQRYRMSTREERNILRKGRTPRPFVAETRIAVTDLVYERFSDATTRALRRVYGLGSSLNTHSEVPF